jgi:hypothetical protein
MITIGTHNLLDGEAEAMPFAQVIMFTEAPPNIYSDPVNKTHTLYRSRKQRDLVIAIRDNLVWSMNDVKLHYRLVHIGIIKVTPHRGIFWITFTYEGKKYAIICEHRINAWFPPFKRGEAKLRNRWWHKHTHMSNKIQKRLLDKGYIIIAGGDPNAPEGVNAYPFLNETVEMHFDRVACSKPIYNSQELDKGGSDHHKVITHTRAA